MKISGIFRNLVTSWHHDAAGDQVELFAAELAAQVARESGAVCVGLIRPEAVKRYFGLVYFLDLYGLTLRKRYRKQVGEPADSVFVYLEQKPATDYGEFDGAVVYARPVHVPYELEAAA